MVRVLKIDGYIFDGKRGIVLTEDLDDTIRAKLIKVGRCPY